MKLDPTASKVHPQGKPALEQKLEKFMSSYPFPRLLIALPVFAALALSLQGCFIVVEEDEDLGDSSSSTSFNSDPSIDVYQSWWTCDYSPYDDAFFFEFQAVVEDPDDWYSVDEVIIYFFAPGSPTVLDSFAMNHEGGETWGGIVWEAETYLFCGEPVDAIIEARNYLDGTDSLTILY